MKKAIYFIVALLPWFISGILFSNYTNFFSTLSLPWFSLPQKLYKITWIILYILIAISIYKVYTSNNKNYIKEYNKTVVSNYLFNQLFLFFMFFLKNPFLGFVDSLIILITSLFLYYETKELDDKASKFLIPYVFFNIYATILSLTIYFMNF